MSRQEHISMSVIRRLPRYYRFLTALLDSGIVRISSGELAARMGITASQIRQDLNCFGGFGQQGYGYVVEDLHRVIGEILGLKTGKKTVLIGAGPMGKVVATHMFSDSHGFELIGIFDRDERIVGTSIKELTVQNSEELEAFCQIHKPVMAVICVPKEAVPELVDSLVKQGVKSFWNFSHFDILLRHPDTVVENVHLNDSLMTLSYRAEEQK